MEGKGMLENTVDVSEAKLRALKKSEKDKNFGLLVETSNQRRPLNTWYFLIMKHRLSDSPVEYGKKYSYLGEGINQRVNHVHRRAGNVIVENLHDDDDEDDDDGEDGEDDDKDNEGSHVEDRSVRVPNRKLKSQLARFKSLKIFDTEKPAGGVTDSANYGGR
uniref:Uncharacterized protein n=1 Tax=Vespula pensylvanica TaxID=30213 RepID=A0A834UBP4_VESPE|nr:hypothetical protein H0235_005471 [Vespula pensylvanica]